MKYPNSDTESNGKFSSEIENPTPDTTTNTTTTLKCKNCGAEIDTLNSEVVECVYCGSSIKSAPNAKPKNQITGQWWFWVMIVLLAVSVMMNIGNKQTPNTASTSGTPSASPSASSYVSVNFQNALRKAESYSKLLYMSKKGIYDQLISKYGANLPADAAQYAIDNITADWNANALKYAKDYQKRFNMSKKAVYDQLIAGYGGKFTKSEAQYAIDHLND